MSDGGLRRVNIVRRFGGALQTAQWSRIVVELALLVAGILIALAVNNWMDERRETRTEREYLELLGRDLEQDLDTLDEIRRFEEAQIAASILVFRGLRRGVAPADREAVSAALGQLTSRRTLRLRRAAYTNLLSTGDLRLIRNAALRDRIVRLYENNERAQTIRDRNNQEYVDRIYVTYLLDQGLVAPRPARSLPSITRSDAAYADSVGIVPRVDDDPLWSLPPDAPQLFVLANRAWYRGTVSQNALFQTQQVVAEIGVVRQAIAQELSTRRWP
jgi:hypothetical protein